MPLKAKLEGNVIISVFCSEEEWLAAQSASRGNEHRLRMACCNAPAIAKHSPLELRFFAHKSGFDSCPSGGVSDEGEVGLEMALELLKASKF